MSPTAEGTRAGALHRDALVIDLHVDTPTTWLEDPGFALATGDPRGHVDLPRLRAGGVDGIFFVAWVEPPFHEAGGRSFERARSVLVNARQRVADTDGLRVVDDGPELFQARERGEVGVFLAVEGGHAIEASLERLGELRALGARYMTLTWNHPNEWADACCSEPLHGGLTDFGRTVVTEMERLGVLPDLSHVADTTFWDALDTLSGPALVSHSCARALVEHPRNLTDEMIRALADTGGVVGVNFFPGFVDRNFAGRMLDSDLRRMLWWAQDAAAEVAEQGPEAALAAYREAREKTGEILGSIPRPPLERLLEHVEHMVDLVGAEHVAVGSDLDGIQAVPEGIDSIADLPVFTAALLERGFTAEEVTHILGANVMRILEASGG